MQHQTRTCFTPHSKRYANGGRRYHPLVSSSTISSANTSFYRSGGCRDQIQSCYNTGSTSTCSRAQSSCNNNILSPLAGNYDVYYVLAKNPDPYPPDLSTYLGSSSLMKKIGAESDWEETSDAVYDNFAETGDWMHNSAPNLETVINSGVRTIIYDGDAVSCTISPILIFAANRRSVGLHPQFQWGRKHGGSSMRLCAVGVTLTRSIRQVNNLQTQFSTQFKQTAFSNWTVAGHAAGIFKNAGTFSYVRIFGA